MENAQHQQASDRSPHGAIWRREGSLIIDNATGTVVTMLITEHRIRNDKFRDMIESTPELAMIGATLLPFIDRGDPMVPLRQIAIPRGNTTLADAVLAVAWRLGWKR